MSLEISLRVTGQSNQGGRKYMEDAFVVAYQQTDDKKDLEYAFFGIFDGHGGKEAALYAKNNLLDNIVNFKNFWQDDDELVLKAIRDGFLTTHLAMWKEVGKSNLKIRSQICFPPNFLLIEFFLFLYSYTNYIKRIF